MDITKLKNIAQKNEVRIDNHKAHNSRPQFFYSSLRNAFGFYFKTFITNNTAYNAYISATSTDKKKSLSILESQFLDEENTVLSIVSFERFFELFIKYLLKKTNPKLVHSENYRSKSNSTWTLLTKIQAKTFKSFIPFTSKGIHSIPFSETLKRFYDLLDYTKDSTKNSNRIVKKFAKTIQPFSFLDDTNYKATFEFINWYRDRILHNGNKLPTLRFFDFIVTQRIIPIANRILKADKEIPSDWLYFTTTISGIKILDHLMNLKFEVTNQKTTKKIGETFDTLLLIAHLKELGRANMNMNNSIKRNQATYEYNYKDPIGRGERFALIEKEKYPDARERKKCPCCSGLSLVLYRINGLDLPIPSQTNIDWIKCYTCEYHLRYNVFDLHYFDRNFEKLFDYKLY